MVLAFDQYTANGILLAVCGVVLWCSAKALSKYTDMVDSVSREQLNRLAEATDAARLALKQVRCIRRRGVLVAHGSSRLCVGMGRLLAAAVLVNSPSHTSQLVACQSGSEQMCACAN